MNRLADETSPYLRQHRDNPVDWWAWGREALQAAADGDKPILLSVGYSACHWCHVMAHESFEDDEVAAVMNDGFVCIKVDREERPDIDAIYMEAVQAISGHGGWPMTVFMTSDGQPFFGGTYYPKDQFLHLLSAITDAWRERRAELLDQAGQITQSLNRMATMTTPEGQTLPGTDVLNNALQQIGSVFDPEWGGFGKPPKFPQAMTLELCLRAHAHNGGDGARTVVSTSLDAMASGGMYDHLGGGFARYSVDAFWMVPHFEKMLYDQALLARTYLHAWQQLGEARWKQVLEETVTYVFRDLRQPEGGFSSAEDADSEGEEGRFYVWRVEEIEDVLGSDLAAKAIEWYGVTKSGNFEGSNILHRPMRGDLERPPDIEEARRRLFEARRASRPARPRRQGADRVERLDARRARPSGGSDRPNRLARCRGRQRRLPPGERPAETTAAGCGRGNATGARVTSRSRLTMQPSCRRSCRSPKPQGSGVGSTKRSRPRTGCSTSSGIQKPAACSPPGSTAKRSSRGPRTCSTTRRPLRTASPHSACSGSPLSPGEQRYRHHAEQILALVGSLATTHPLAFPELLSAVDFHRSGATEIAIVGDRGDLVEAVLSRYLPNAVVAWGEPYDSPLWE